MAHLIGGNKCAGLALRRLLHSPKMEFVMEAHSGLSAKVAAEAGFKGLWASGLSVSASMGLRDRNEASWTQVLNVAERIVEAAPGVPVLLDGDTGYGDFNSARRLVQALERSGVAGVCLEDKLFPKTNSFLTGVGGADQDLADVEEFCLKLEACKEAQHSPHFNLVARVEALIAGAGMDEALYRAEEYRKAGADAILIHSRQREPSEIKEFCQKWECKLPVIIVPTTYGVGVSKDEFFEAGASLIIWANHNMRASVAAMRETSKLLCEAETMLPDLEKKITPVKEIFSLMNEDEMSVAEVKYTPKLENVEIFPGQQGKPLKYDGFDHTPSKKLSPGVVVDTLIAEGSSFFTGVPDSLLRSFNEEISGSTKLTNVVSANEGTAISLAAGHYLATSKVPTVYMQNSGLGNAVNPLLSLAHPDVYGIPMVIFVGWRGEFRDEPQHMVQGGCMHEMITDMGFDWFELPVTNETATQVVKEARHLALAKSSPVFVVVRKNTFASSTQRPATDELTGPFSARGLSRMKAIEVIDSICAKKDWVRICTTGKSSRELYQTSLSKEGPGHLEDFLVVGSMGHASSIAQGIFLGMGSKSRKGVVCIDGDGAALMHMGSLSQGGHLKTNMLHIVLNNGTHESVGMEFTACVDPAVSLTGVALSCGYEKVKVVETPSDIVSFVEEYNSAGAKTGPWMLEVRVGVCDPNTPLPRPKEAPAQRKVGVMKHISS